MGTKRNLAVRIQRNWRGMVIGSGLGLLLLGSTVEGQVGGRLPDGPGAGNRWDVPDARWPNAPAAQPPRGSAGSTEELRRLQVELDALNRAQSGFVADPVPSAADSVPERVKLKERVIELI